LRRLADQRMLQPRASMPATAADTLYAWYRAGYLAPTSG
jgi:hypothetical protein